MKETPPFSPAGPHIRSGFLESTSFQKSSFRMPAARMSRETIKQCCNIEELFFNTEGLFSNIEEIFSNIEELFSNIEELFSNIEELFADIAELFSNKEELFADIAELFSNKEELYSCPTYV
jgi:methyl-accepting chemotaxis protein